MGALLRPGLHTPKPQAEAELAELHRARGALQADQLAAENRARAAELPLLRRQARRAARAAERAAKRMGAEIDAAIAGLVAADPGLARKAAILVSIPGVAAVTAAAILAEMPEIGSLAPGQVGSLSGTAPVTRRVRAVEGKARIAAAAPPCAAPSTCQPSPPCAAIPTSRGPMTASAAPESPPRSPSPPPCESSSSSPTPSSETTESGPPISQHDNPTITETQ